MRSVHCLARVEANSALSPTTSRELNFRMQLFTESLVLASVSWTDALSGILWRLIYRYNRAQLLSFSSWLYIQPSILPLSRIPGHAYHHSQGHCLYVHFYLVGS